MQPQNLPCKALILKEIKCLHYAIFDATMQNMAKLRQGRKRVTTSFTLPPELHEKFYNKLPVRGARSKVLEELIKSYCENRIKYHPKIGFYGEALAS